MFRGDRQITNDCGKFTAHLHIKWSERYSTFAANGKFRAVTNYSLFIHSDTFFISLESAIS